ncbi:type II toxin-antitoxin system CcdA family antitoxin [Marinovum sp. KMM 9879]
MHATSSAKKRTNVTIDSGLLEAARELGLNVSAISEAALAAEVRAARASAWQAENLEAMAQRRAWIEANGPPLARWQVLGHKG